MNYVQLGYWELALAAGLLFLNGAVSIAFRLGIARQLLVSAVRMCVQLGIAGLVLRFIFAQQNPLWMAGLGVLMLAAAGREVLARQKTRFTGGWTWYIATVSISIAATSILIFALTVLVRPEPWYAPRYALPFFGMLLGNAMTGISLGLDTLAQTVKRDRRAIETRLALGLSFAQSLEVPVRDALRTGMMPIVNGMAASGLVSLPGMMTGQILGGTPPAEAVKYQILIMFLIAATTAGALVLAVMAARWRLTDNRQRLRLDRYGGD
ncbi:MAG TPA: iron export ABC transporter permease subunit FetB [Rhizobiales bacterium]|nr:iron export ABC transporter permease subunit FetB [Hyphomicrobiales bacterium]